MTIDAEQEDTLGSAQRRVLRNLAQASDDIIRLGVAIADMGTDMRDAVTAGQHCRDMNHQIPFDLQAALIKRQTYLQEAARLDLTEDIVFAASTGRWGR